ncbi:MAG: hypothetical protein AAF740_05430 [Bacteroidota bacterium]
MNKKVLIIHPHDKSTSFLERIRNYLSFELQNSVHYFNIKPNELSHNECLKVIKDFPSSGLVLFMGHGRSNCLYGAVGDDYGTMPSEDAILEHPDRYFSNENYINLENVGVFREKKVIALTCNSNDQIGREAIRSGAKVFLGFGNLPTSIEELKEEGEQEKRGLSLSTVEKALKSEINYVIKKSIVIGITKNHSFGELMNVIWFVTNQRISDYLVNKKTISERKVIANYLYRFKREIKIHGDKSIKLT